MTSMYYFITIARLLRHPHQNKRSDVLLKAPIAVPSLLSFFVLNYTLNFVLNVVILTQSVQLHNLLEPLIFFRPQLLGEELYAQLVRFVQFRVFCSVNLGPLIYFL